MGKPLDLTGQRFGRLTALIPAEKTAQGFIWEFRCDCGNLYRAAGKIVKSGHTRSCGCLASEVVTTRSIVHGHAKSGEMTRTYKAWRAAKMRCFNPNWWAYRRYGGRGITMCETWRNDFSSFLQDMGECPEGYTIERGDNDGNYEPGNCTWAPAADQHVSKSGVILVKHKGSTLNLTQYARARGVNYAALWGRTKRGQSPIEAADAIVARKAKLAQ